MFEKVKRGLRRSGSFFFFFKYLNVVRTAGLHKVVQTMADDSVLPSPTEITSLADTSVFDSKVTETSKENLCMVSTSNVDEEMPQVEARVVVVQEAGKQEELLKALKDCWTTSYTQLCTNGRALAVLLPAAVLHEHAESGALLHWIQEEGGARQIGDIGSSYGWSYSKRMQFQSNTSGGKLYARRKV